MKRYHGIAGLLMDVCKVNIVEAREQLTGIWYILEGGKEGIFLTNPERYWAYCKIHDRTW